MENKKKKIKGFTTRAGILFATAMLTLGPNIKQASANQYNTIKEQEENVADPETDLEKYFNCQTPMNENYKIDSQSEIYKILTYYEGREPAENGQFLIKKDAYNNLVVGSGLTVKYQNDVLEYLSNYGNTTQEIIENVTKIIDSGTNVYIPESVIDQMFIKEIQRCRSAAIEDAKSFGINLSENQINILTELNYRYGKGNSGKLLSSLVQGQKLEDYTVKIDRTLTVSQWENIDLKIPTEITKVENGKVYYKAYIKPFNALGKEATIENLKSSDIATSLKESPSDQFEGDWRRCLFRQVGIEYDVLTLIEDKTGKCKYWENGEVKDSNIVDYLEEIENKREENKENLSEETIENPSQEEQTQNEAETEESQNIFTDNEQQSNQNIFTDNEQQSNQNINNVLDIEENETQNTKHEQANNTSNFIAVRPKNTLVNKIVQYIRTGIILGVTSGIQAIKMKHIMKKIKRARMIIKRQRARRMQIDKQKVRASEDKKIRINNQASSYSQRREEFLKKYNDNIYNEKAYRASNVQYKSTQRTSNAQYKPIQRVSNTQNKPVRRFSSQQYNSNLNDER